MLPIQLGRHSRDALMRQGYPVQWKEYDMGHEVCGAEIDDIGRWLRSRLS